MRPFNVLLLPLVQASLLTAAVAVAQPVAQQPAPAPIRSPLLAGGHDVDVPAILNAALDGDVHAQRTMGDILRLGIGGEMNGEASMAWFRRAAAGGDDYSIGFTSAKTDRHDEALAAYRRSAERGDAAAQASLGAWYFGAGGSGVRPPVDYARSFAWYKRSADQGYFEGCFGLGGLYGTGLGVTRDMVEAHKWMSIGLSLAGPIGIAKHMRDALNSVERTMTASQIAEARKRADEWRATAPAALPLPSRSTHRKSGR